MLSQSANELFSNKIAGIVIIYSMKLLQKRTFSEIVSKAMWAL